MRIAKYILKLSVTLLLMVFPRLSAQDYLKDYTPHYDDNRAGKIFMIPETSFWLGSYTNIEVAPQIGYYIFDRWSLGTGPHYIYYSQPGYMYADRQSTHIWGIKAFSRFSLIRNAANFLPFYLFDELFLHTEYERLNLNTSYFNFPAGNDRTWVDYFFVGVGLSQNLGPNTSYFLMLLWNLNESYFSLYRNPTYRIGVSIVF